MEDHGHRQHDERYEGVIILKTFLLVCLSSLIVCIANKGEDVEQQNTASNEKVYQAGYLCVDGNEVKTGTVMWDETSLWISMDDVFEALGGEVIYHEDPLDVDWKLPDDWEPEDVGPLPFEVIATASIKYQGDEYICWLNSYSFGTTIAIQNIKNAGSLNVDDYILLNPMFPDGQYNTIGGKIYLQGDTARRLFEAMGCVVEMDEENKSVTISSEHRKAACPQLLHHTCVTLF